MSEPYERETEIPKPGEVPFNLDASAPSLAAAYTLEQLAADEQSELISLAALPSWPRFDDKECPPSGHGWGQHLNEAVGYGLRPGESVAIGASSAGAGKTAWLMQIADGLALRSASIASGTWKRSEDALTPVLVLSELSAPMLMWRTLGRWTGCGAHIFRAGATGRRLISASAETAWGRARAALEQGPLADMRHWMRVADVDQASLAAAKGAGAFADHITRIIESWLETISKEYPQKSIVPVLVIDPLQRFQPPVDEVRGLNELCKEIRKATVGGDWLTFITSDTNKDSAKGVNVAGRNRSDEQEGTGVFRGSYNLIHEATVCLNLRRPSNAKHVEVEPYPVETVVVKNRWGKGREPWPRFDWFAPRMRFVPLSEDETNGRVAAEIKAKKDEPPKDGKANGKTPNGKFQRVIDDDRI